MKPLKYFQRCFIILSCSLIVTGSVFASESSITRNQSRHSFSSVGLPAATPVIKTVAITQVHSEDKPLAPFIRFVKKEGVPLKFVVGLLKCWEQLLVEEDYLNGYEVFHPVNTEPQWSFMMREKPQSKGEYDIILAERIPGGASYYLTSEKGELRGNAFRKLKGIGQQNIPKEEAEIALKRLIQFWQKWHRKQEPDS